MNSLDAETHQNWVTVTTKNTPSVDATAPPRSSACYRARHQQEGLRRGSAVPLAAHLMRRGDKKLQGKPATQEADTRTRVSMQPVIGSPQRLGKSDARDGLLHDVQRCPSPGVNRRRSRLFPLRCMGLFGVMVVKLEARLATSARVPDG